MEKNGINSESERDELQYKANYIDEVLYNVFDIQNGWFFWSTNSVVFFCFFIISVNFENEIECSFVSLLNSFCLMRVYFSI